MAEPGVLRISGATSLALHTAALLAGSEGHRLSATAIAQRLSVSQAHLAKVLQRLAKARLVDSARGRGGGFTLSRPAGRIRLLDVYEAVEGRFTHRRCALDRRNCAAARCIFDGVLSEMDEALWSYLSRTRLSQLRDVYGGDDGN